MSNFYKEFPKIQYTFADGTTQTLTDINIKFGLSDLVKSTTDVFYPFGWRDEDRPDSISDKYYDSSDFYWLVLMSNDVYDINHDLPVPQLMFDEYLTRKYSEIVIENGGTQNLEDIYDYLTTTVHHYEDVNGYIIDHETYLAEPNTKSVSLYEYEFSENEKKRSIQLLDASRAAAVQYDLEKKLRDIKSGL